MKSQIKINDRDYMLDEFITEIIEIKAHVIFLTEVTGDSEPRNIYGINKETGEMWQVGDMWDIPNFRRDCPDIKPHDVDNIYIGIDKEGEDIIGTDVSGRSILIDISTGKPKAIYFYGRPW